MQSGILFSLALRAWLFSIFQSMTNKTSLAIEFSKKRENASNEKRESQKFLSDFETIILEY